MLTTYGYHHVPAEPSTVVQDGVTYDRIERLPRNLRPGDLIRLVDNTDRQGLHIVYAIVTGVDTWPQSFEGMRRHAPQCIVRFRFPEHMCPVTWQWASWGNRTVYRDTETKEPTSVYRVRK